MNRSETITKLAAAMAKAQPKVAVAEKNSVNPHLKNKYANLGAVWDAVAVVLEENDLSVIQMPAPSDDGKLHLETVLMHGSGEWISSIMVMPLSKQDPQGYGSALTYARRYALAALMGVTQDDDDGARSIANEIKSEAHEACYKIAECQTLEELQSVFAAAYKAVKDNKAAQNMVVAAKDARKKELSNA